jgi:multidrug efflux pump subunit AcrB
MVRFLLTRPIAVSLGFLVLIIFGIISFKKITISLLPDIDVPKIVIRINYPNNLAAKIEENVTRVLRENLVSLNKLDEIESESTNHTAILNLTYDYGTRMDLAYVEVNEKIDRLMNSMPAGILRPEVIRINTSDIPIVRLQINPKTQSNYLQTSLLVEKVIKKRLEQIKGISLVDINGKQSEVISIEVNQKALRAVGLNETDLINAIQSSNREIGSLSVKEGYYRFFIKIVNHLEDTDEITKIPLKLKDGTISNIGRFSNITSEVNEPQGYHLYNGQDGLVITIHKKSNSRMSDVMSNISKVVNSLKKSYPEVNFNFTQDQTFLLEQSIDNLTQDLVFGGIFCIALLFLFLGNYASPILMGISIPISLLLTCIFFYLFNLSFNIISLSGLALGIGMLIDNSIIVIDNITRKRRDGLTIEESCIIGTNQVISPVTSNVLTTIAIYLPLIYMSGLAGALVFDQAIALTISLGVSLLVAFCLNPLLYKFFLRTDPEKLKNDTQFYKSIANGYHRMIYHIFNHKRKYFIVTLLFMPIGIILIKFLPINILPQITTTESLAKIDWNQSIDAAENLRRVKMLNVLMRNKVIEWETDAGISQFLFHEGNNTTQNATIYYRCKTEREKEQLDKVLNLWFKKNYPLATCLTESAPNGFTQLFENKNPHLEVRFRSLKPETDQLSSLNLEKILKLIPTKDWKRGRSFYDEPSIEMSIDNSKMNLYGIEMASLHQKLTNLFGIYKISELKRFGDVKIIQFKSETNNINNKLFSTITGKANVEYPLNTFVTYTFGSEKKYLTADKSGLYKSISFEKGSIDNMEQFQKRITEIANVNGFSVVFSGQYISNEILLRDMWVIFLISMLLLYFILAVQFENLIHPFIVMFTIPLGISGAMLVLWLAGGSIDIMAAIGFVVVLGIIVDDPSLKVETINRLRKEYLTAGMKNKNEILTKAIHEAGEICLKPLLMVSLTTSLALLPVFFSGGIGNELQRPLVYVIIGGLTFGTFFTLWFIPLAYWFITYKK